MNKRTKFFLLAAVITIFIGLLMEVNYVDLSWTANSSIYLAGSGIFVMIILLVNSLISGAKNL